MIKEDRPNSSFGPRYTIEATSNKRIGIARNFPKARRTQENQYHVSVLDNDGRSVDIGMTDTNMQEFFLAYIAVKESYGADN